MEMTTARWMEIPPSQVALRDLFWCQESVGIERMIEASKEGYVSSCGDVYPHVVIFAGKSYLSDGHHRALVRLLRGETEIEARVKEVTPD